MADKVSLLEFEGNSNIGIFMYVCDKFAILGRDIDSKKKKEIQEVLGVRVYTTTILGTDLAGIFLCGNNEILICPEIFENEREVIDSISREHNVKVVYLSEKLNTFGNNLCVGENLIICNSNYNKKFLEDLKKWTKYKTIKLENKEFTSAGAVCSYIKGKFYVSQELNEEEVSEFVEKIAGVGTINSGSPYISSGIVGNKNGILIGSMSSSVEIQNIVEDLEYI